MGLNAKARLCAIAIATTAVPFSSAHADGGTTVVLRPAASGNARRGHLNRLEKAMERAARKQPFTIASRRHTPSASCASDAACLADKGGKLGADRIVGTLVDRGRSRFVVTYLVVDVASKSELARHELTTTSRRTLESKGGAELEAALAKAGSKAPPTGAGAAAAGPFSASAPATVHGDGRTPVAIEISGSPPPRSGELSKLPEPPAIDCDHALSLPGGAGRSPAVIAPAVRKPRTVTCKVSHRDATTELSFRAEPPKQPGIYLELSKPVHKATDKTLPMTAFVVDKSGRVLAPSSVRAATSAGTMEIGERGALTLALPDSRAPRVITVALTDGSYTGAAFVPVWGVTRLDIEAEARSKVSMRIAGRWVEGKYARRGYAQLQIEVPPGVSKGVVRATRRGAAVESVADLRLPRLPRLAAVAMTDQVPAAGATPILVAVATADGRPAPADTQFETRAEIGTLAPAVARGPGLWTIEYTATTKPGSDQLIIRMKGDRKAGRLKLPLTISAGAAEVIHLELPDRDYRPGDAISGAAIIRDSHGNLIERTPTATLGGQALTVVPGTTGFSLTGAVPEKLPVGQPLELEVRAGDLVSKKVIRARADHPVSATIRARGGSRTAKLQLEVRDRHGNLVPTDAFSVVAPGGRPGPLTRDGDLYRGVLRARADARATRVDVRAGDQTLASALVRFEPPRDALLLGGYGEAGWVTSSGDFAAPRLGAGVGVRRFLGPVELALTVGAEGFVFGDNEQAMIGGVMREISRDVVGLALPIRLRARRPLTHRLAISLEGAVVPTRVGVTLGSDFQSDDRYSETVIGGRGRLSVDWRWGMRRANLGVGYGIAELTDGPITGTLEGLTISGGFEWWFADLGG